MAFDGIVTKKIVDELSDLKNYKIDKIYEPDKNTITLGLYGNFQNISILASISNNYRIHLTKHVVKNPNTAPNFCMLLRKHILGYKIKNIYTKSLERIVFIVLENLENPEKPIFKTLIIELMGKHSNIILVDENNIVIDSIRHTSIEENSLRDIYPTAKYMLPNLNKYNILEMKNFEEFYSHIDSENVVNSILDNFAGIGAINLNYIVKNISLQKDNEYKSSKLFAHKIYTEITKLLFSKSLTIDIIYKNNLPKNYALKCLDKTSQNGFELNYSLDDFYFEKESLELFKNYRNSILNLILSTLKKYEKRLQNIDDKLDECSKMDTFKLYGELIIANLYKIPNYNVSSISLENYYDNNKPITITLDKKYSPQNNAKRFFKKYNKLKNALDIVGKQKIDTSEEIDYIESIIYEIENCKNIDDIKQIYDEIEDNPIFENKSFKSKYFSSSNGKNKNYKIKSNSKKQLTSNKFANFNPLKFVIDGYTILVGRNNKENDYLTNKFANKHDIWFHTKDIHGSHVILKTHPNEITPDNVIYEAAKLAALHSKAKNSSNVPVDYCEVSFVKKIPGNKPGLVIYKNNKTLYV